MRTILHVSIAFLLLHFACSDFSISVLQAKPVSISLADYQPVADGITDDTPALMACFRAIGDAGGGVITIPPGDYFYAGTESIPLCSDLTVFAYGARFHLPETLGDKARIRMFRGQDISRFSWHGGEFYGNGFDPARQDNPWPPNADTRILVITTSPEGKTNDLLFRDLCSDGVAGPVIFVQGATKPNSESETITFAGRVSVKDCVLLRTGPFMWDYGYLWQQIVWPEDYEPWEVERAYQYFRNDLIREDVVMADGDDRVQFENEKKPISKTVCFFGDTLPKNVVRGRQYFVVESASSYVKISESPNGPALKFDGEAGAKTTLIHSVSEAFYSLFAPIGWGGAKGAVDLESCTGVNMTGCQLSAIGDTMHIRRCENVVFSNNQILGSRMGAFFIAEFCKNVTITGNTVDGTNGSRVMSVEKSTEDITIIGNTFRNGGRGSWINQPKNMVLKGNIFIDNTTKGEKDPRRGRRDFRTGGWESYPEVYFTLHQPNGKYGPVIVSDNIFQPGDSCSPQAMTFAPNGTHLLIRNNISIGEERRIKIESGCTDVEIEGNKGLVPQQ